MWPENQLAARVFLQLETQWHYQATMSALIRQGLRYEALAATLSMMQIEGARHAEVFEGVRLMEAAALAVFHAEK